jgi:hypothetical protein
MTESAGLERGYRRLLAWYPQPFRSEHDEEMLAVLMASSGDGQRRPGLMESANLIWSALGMRLRQAGSRSAARPWADGLAVFSVIAPVFLVAASVLEVALPYRLPRPMRFSILARVLGEHPQIGGLTLLHQPDFLIAVGGQVIVAALVLLGLRRVALVAIVAYAVYWYLARYWIPGPLQLLSTSVYMLTATALIASPGPRHGRHLVRWGHMVVLLLAAAAVQASTLLYWATTPMARIGFLRPPGTTAYLVISVVLGAAAVCLAVVLRVDLYFLLLLAVMFYPYVLQLASSPASTDSDLIGHPTPAHLAVLFLPPLLVACAALLSTVTPLRSRAGLPPGPDEPEPT